MNRISFNPPHPSTRPILPASNVWFGKTLEALEPVLDQFSVTFIEGSPLTGKSTLLCQIAAQANAFQIPHVQVSIPRSIEVGPFLELVLDRQKSLMKASPIHNLELEGTNSRPLPFHAALEMIVENTKTHPHLLLIDGAENIQNGISFFEFIIREVRESKVLIACRTLPKIDPLMAMDFGLFHFDGMNSNEARELIQKANVKWPEREPEALQTLLIKATEGNPFLIKSALAQALLEKRPFSKDDIDGDLTRSRNAYLERMKNEATPEELDLLETASLIEFDRATEGRILENLSPRLLGWLPASITLDAETRSFFKSKIIPEKINRFRESILDILEEITYSERKEALHQLIELNRPTDAAQTLEGFGRDMRATGDFLDHVKMTETIKHTLSPKECLLRVRSLRVLGRTAEAEREALHLLSKNPEKEIEYETRDTLALTYRLTQNLNLAGAQYEAILKDLPSSDTLNRNFYFKFFASALADKAEMIATSDSKLAFQYLSQAEALLNQTQSTTESDWANYYFSKGFVCNDVFDFETAIEAYQKATPLFRRLKIKVTELNAKRNIGYGEYCLGRFSDSRETLQYTLEEAKKFSIPFCRISCLILLTTDLFYKSGPLHAFRVLQTEGLVPLSTSRLNLFETRIAEFLIDIHLSQSDYYSAIQLARRLSQQECESNPNYAHFMVALQNIIEFFDLSTEINRTSSGKIIKTIQSLFESNLTEQEYKQRLLIYLLNLNVQNHFPIAMAPFLQNLSSGPQKIILNKMKALDQIRLKLYEGQHHLNQMDTARALPLLQEVANAAQAGEFLRLKAQALISIAIIEIHQNQIANAAQTLEAAERASTPCDIENEFALIPILKTFVFQKLGQTERSGLDRLHSLPNGHPYWAFAHQICPTLFGAHTFDLSPFARRRVDVLLTLCGSSTLARVQVISPQGSIQIDESDLQKRVIQKTPIVLQEKDRTIYLDRKPHALEAKPVLYDLLRFLLLNAGKEFDKEELTTQVWFEKYNPFVHDARIYTSVKRLRELLKAHVKTEVIINQGGKYTVPLSVSFSVIVPVTSDTQVLNERQKWILKYVQTHGQITRQTTQTLLNISPSLAKNDLSALAKRGKLKPLGQGRNSYYTFN